LCGAAQGYVDQEHVLLHEILVGDVMTTPENVLTENANEAMDGADISLNSFPKFVREMIKEDIKPVVKEEVYNKEFKQIRKPPTKRQMMYLDLFYFQSKSIRDVALILRVKQETVRDMKYRAVKNLAYALGMRYQPCKRRFVDSRRRHIY